MGWLNIYLAVMYLWKKQIRQEAMYRKTKIIAIVVPSIELFQLDADPKHMRRKWIGMPPGMKFSV